MKKIELFFIATLLITTEVFSSGGSLYTRYGLGDVYNDYSARRFGMGGLGIALTDNDYLNYLNPAGSTDLNLVRFETGMIYTGENMQDNSSSTYNANTFFSGFMFGIPIKHDLGFTINFGVVPVTNVHYAVSQAATDTISTSHTIDYSGDGGISKIFLSTSYKLPLDFSIGASFDYYTGKIDYNSAITFESTSDFTDATYDKQYSYHGIGYTIGFISTDFAKIIGIGGVKNLRLGVAYTSSVPLHCDSVINLISAAGTTEAAFGSSTVHLPYKFGVGLAFLLKDSYQFTLDYLYQPFSQLTFNGVGFPYMQDYRKMSLGLEYRNPDVRTFSFWDQLMLRGGLSYEQSQYIINGTSINQVSVYTGCSIPLGSDNSLDFGLQYGRRGTTDNNLLQENIFNFSISISLGELWFQHSER
jgi:hypothetical protein